MEIVEEGRLLQIAGGRAALHPDDAVGDGVRPDRDLQQLQSGGIHHPHMAGGVLDDQWVIRDGLVQLLRRDVAASRQLVVVIAPRPDPLPRRDGVEAEVLREPRDDLLRCAAAGQRDLQKAAGRGGKMTVSVHKGGEKGTALQIRGAQGSLCLSTQLRSRPYRGDAAVPHQDRLRPQGALHGDHSSVVIEGIHPMASFLFVVVVCADQLKNGQKKRHSRKPKKSFPARQAVNSPALRCSRA